jgi:hypothetical protein
LLHTLAQQARLHPWDDYNRRSRSRCLSSCGRLYQSRRMRKSIITFAILLSSMAWAKNPNILPSTFNGWKLNPTSVKTSSDPTAADSADFAVLKEYGFTDFQSGTYTRADRTMQVKAARFTDASGAYGAFTFYRQPQMQAEQIGDRAVSNNSRIMFQSGNILADVNLERMSAMSAADLRALAAALPMAKGQAAACPPCQGRLPKNSLRANTERYILGPVALEHLRVPIPASLVDFGKGAEIEFGKYRSANGEGAMTLIEYPTPQIAADRMRAIQAAALPSRPYFFKRSGPLLIAINGSIPEAEAQSLLGMINYDADVTTLQATRPDPKEDRGAFIVALILLVVVVLGIALVLSFAFGGLRLLARKFFPNRAFGRPDATEIIRLNLK